MDTSSRSPLVQEGMRLYQIEDDVIEAALSQALGTAVVNPTKWHCPCGCGAYCAYVRDDRALWVAINHTFEEGDIVRVQGLTAIQAISALPDLYMTHAPPDAAFVAVWLTQGLADALITAFANASMPPKELN